MPDALQSFLYFIFACDKIGGKEMKMKTVYIDCTGSVPIKNQPYHGGISYTNSLLLELQKKNNPEHQFVLLLPADYNPEFIIKESIYSSGYFKTLVIGSLSDDFKMDENSTLFFPLLYKIEDFRALKKIKDNNPTVAFVATIHDLRHHFNKYGSISRYFYKGVIFHFYVFYKPFRWLHNTFILNPAIRRGMSVIDRIFTVSNYSLQKIMKLKFKGNIIPHIQTPKPRESNESGASEERYFLFLSGNRPVKNFLRTLEAFCEFKKTDNKDYHLYVTGVSPELMNRFLRYKRIDKDTVDKWVRIFGYIDDESLVSLYENCSVLLYTSLYEGYGLPLLEAAQFGKPSVSSYITSVPEVLGSCTHYVDPYNIKSISAGMEYMSQEHILKQYEKWLLECYPLLEQRIKIDFDVVLNQIINA
jgi:glycosyltransferase involved in cell wall biosynthesis